MGREARLNVLALAAPGFPRRLRVRGHTLTSILVGPSRGRGADAVAVIAERVLEAPPLSEASLREQHAVVIEVWRRADALVPARFGTVLGERELKARVAAVAPALARVLRHVRGRVQMTVRVFGDPPPGDPASLPRGTGTAYMTALRDRAAALSRVAAEVRRPVEAFVVDERLEPGQGALLLSLFHLIATADEARYRAALQSARGPAQPQHVTISGPWPPFAFAPELPE